MSWLTKYGGTPGIWGFAGAVLGAVTATGTAIFLQWFLPWWRRPILVITHRRDLEGVLVNTDNTSGAHERYARIQVRNEGTGIAKNARCMIDRIVFSPADAAAKPNGEEV